jgi:preprotein translocase subunit SecG
MSLSVLVNILTAVLALDCVILLLVILVQRGRGGGLAAAFGGAGAETAFGTRAASTAKKATVVLAAIFVVLSGAVYLLRNMEQNQAGQMGPRPETALPFHEHEGE